MAWVFQYGSNASTERINAPDRLDGAARDVGLARTRNEFDLAFTHWSRRNECAAADLIDGHRQIYGVLYEIPDHRVFRSLRRDGLKTLDQIEQPGYQSEPIEVELVSDGYTMAAVTYRVVDRKADIKTAPHYVKHIVDGLRSHGAPPEYLDYVKRRAEENNPSEAASFRSL
jgi:hypothetical protein